MPPLAARLRELREAAGVSQQELAFRAGLSIGVIARIEQGKKEDPKLSTVTALAEALGVGVGDLVPAAGKPARGRRRKEK